MFEIAMPLFKKTKKTKQEKKISPLRLMLKLFNVNRTVDEK